MSSENLEPPAKMPWDFEAGVLLKGLDDCCGLVGDGRGIMAGWVVELDCFGGPSSSESDDSIDFLSLSPT